jgi:DMSO/TMAO reductase YedYZ molybdopterin-dependent catalytic subunit
MTPRIAAIGGTLAALAASLGMLLLRSTLQVRSAPERLMEWLLLFVPPAVFEATLQRLGFDAKRYGLDAAILATVGLLALLGYRALRSNLSLLGLAGVGVGLWLFVMTVIMPLTSAGFFASELLDGKRTVIGGYLAVALTYAGVLGLVNIWVRKQALEAQGPRALVSELSWEGGNGWEGVPRRAALGLLGAAGLAYIATYAMAIFLPRSGRVASVVLSDPQEPLPSGGIDPPSPHPNLVGTPMTTASTGSAPAQSAAAALPEPTTLRQLARDKDGAVLPSGRRPGELASPTTSNDAFYIVTKNAAGDPIIHPQDWRVVVDGEVERPFQLDYATLRKLPGVELTKTLECISNFTAKPELAPFGSELISTARWKGVRVIDILQLVGGVKAGADWLAVLAADEFTSAVPMEVANDPDTVLVYEMNGDPLPREHGYPARLLVPGRYGMKSAKWVVGLRPLRREFVDWYGQRNWSKLGQVKTMTRIDTPAPGALLPAGDHRLAGIAYAGDRGIAKVEYTVDGGKSWRAAELLDPSGAGKDTWVRWEGKVTLAPGAELTVVSRATDAGGALQPEEFALPQPDGGGGWHTLFLKAKP